MRLPCTIACRSVSGRRRRTWKRKGKEMNKHKKTTILDGCKAARSLLAKTAKLGSGSHETC